MYENMTTSFKNIRKENLFKTTRIPVISTGKNVTEIWTINSG